MWYIALRSVRELIGLLTTDSHARGHAQAEVVRHYSYSEIVYLSDLLVV